MTAALGIKKSFIGLILIPIVGNAAEHTTAVVMALKNKMDIAIEIAVGSCLQIALFVAPLLVLVSLFFVPMSIIFLPIELFIFAASVAIATRIVSSGKTNWLEGLLLLAIYAIAAVGFYLI
jgi:Ca2+:H+ antiporter